MRGLIENLQPVWSEAILLLFVVFALLTSVRTTSGRARTQADKRVMAGMLFSLLVLFSTDIPEKGVSVEGVSFVLDSGALYLKKLILIGAAVCVWFGSDWLKYKKYTRFEFSPLIGFSTAGMMLTVSAKTFLTQFLGLEMMHFPLLFLAAYKRYGERSTEAGTKYAIMVFLSSGLYLFGVSVLYACLGTIDFSKIAAADKTALMPALLWGLSFITTGLLLKLGAAPFHSWVADVYEGAPSPVTALFLTIVRMTVIVAFARIVSGSLNSFMFYWKPVLSAVCILSVVIGSFSAIVQTNIKRLAAYTAIALNGFAISALLSEKLSLLFLFLTADLILTAGISAIILSLRVGEELSEKVRILDGQGQAKPVRGALFSLIFLGLSGAPPFAEFWTRFLLFKELTLNGMLWFAVFLMAGGLLIMFVYFRLIRKMYVTSTKEELSLATLPVKTVILATAFLSMFFFSFISPLSGFLKTALFSLG